ncbi:MAG: TfoX/Sxy family protein [Dehalococcoidia bacterium]|nr:TfoX/Sxy family protein [Dehalococcoidia bacterium]
MAYDEELAERVRRALAGRKGISEKKMFGGIAFMLGGNMFCGIVKDQLMVRVGPERYDDALSRPHARPMDFTGPPCGAWCTSGPRATGRTTV